MSHVVQLAKFYDPAHGGIERVVKDYATGLVAAGHEVTVIAFAHDGVTRTDHPSERLRVVRLAPELRIGPVPLSLRYLWHGWRIGRRADIVHVHEPNPLATVAALLAGSRPVRIVTWHADAVRFGPVRHFYRLLQGALCRRARAVLVSSESMRQSSELLPALGPLVQIMPLGLDLAGFATLDPGRAETARAREGGRYVLAVGRLVPYKGFDVLIKALESTDLRAVIVGDGPLRAELEALAGAVGVAGQVRFAGPASDEELRALLAGCDHFAFPSSGVGEAFGLAQIEAMAAGKAVINTSLPTGVPEVSLHERTGLTVPPGDVEALRAAMLRLWNDPALARTLGQAGRERAFARFGRSRLIGRLLEICGIAPVAPGQSRVAPSMLGPDLHGVRHDETPDTMTVGSILYARPRSIDEAVAALAGGGATILAGGTDLYPAHVGRPFDRTVVDLSAIASLRTIADQGDHWRIGAAVTWREIADAALPPLFDGMKAAAREIGGAQVQNTGTIGGNLCNASPAADGVPCLLTLDASVEIAGIGATRSLPLADFILGNRRTALRPGEMVVGITIARPTSARAAGHFLKLGARSYLVISIAMVSGVLEASADGRVARAALAVGACSAVAQRLPRLEADLAGRPVDGTLGDIVTPGHLADLAPLDDIRADAGYRRHAATILTARLLSDLGARMAASS